VKRTVLKVHEGSSGGIRATPTDFVNVFVKPFIAIVLKKAF
jgi:hypothetical protein